MPKVSLLRHPYLYYKRKWLHHRCKYAPMPEGRIVKKINGINITFDFSLGKAIKHMYYNAYEFEIVQVLKTYLLPGGVFIDIGANIGYFSGLALGLIGQSGQVHSFEPVPRYYRFLEEMKQRNPGCPLFANSLALGDTTGKTEIFVDRLNVGGSTLIADLLPDEYRGESLPVEVIRLDDYLREKNIDRVSLIKIDTQGFELHVLRGLSEFLKKNPSNLPPIVTEITPSALHLLGQHPRDVTAFMAEFGYESYCICGGHRIDPEYFNVDSVDVLFKPVRHRT